MSIATGSARRSIRDRWRKHVPTAANVRLRERKLALLEYRRIAVALGLLSVDAIAAFVATSLVGMLYGLALRSAAFAALPVLLGSFTLAGLYRGYWRTPYDRLRGRLFGSFVYAIAIVLISLEASQNSALAAIVCITAAVFIFGFYAEVGLRHTLIRYRLWGGATAFVGGGRTIEYAYRLFSTLPEFGLRPVGFLSSGALVEVSADDALPLLGQVKDLIRLNQRKEIEFVVTSTEADYRRVSRAVQALAPPPTVLLIEGNSRGAKPRLEFNAIRVEAGRDPNTRPNRLARRAMELAVALPAMLLALPLIVLLAALIKLTNPGPALYFQTRVGQNNRALRVVKIRTMYRDAEERLQSHLRSDPAARIEWDRFCKLSRDPRVLPYIGNLIRCMSLDEIPQLWNVIRGEMSLVGPRPFPSYHTERFDLAFQQLRSSVRPGLTGLWQVSSRSNGDLRTQQVQDVYYIRNWSIWLDAYILLQTVPAVLGACGAR